MESNSLSLSFFEKRRDGGLFIRFHDNTFVYISPGRGDKETSFCRVMSLSSLSLLQLIVNCSSGMSYQLCCQQARCSVAFSQLLLLLRGAIQHSLEKKKCWIVEWFLAPRANSRRLYRLLLQGLLLLFSLFLIFFLEFFCVLIILFVWIHTKEEQKIKDLPVNGLSFVCLLFSQEYQQLLLKLERGEKNLLEMPTHNERNVRISIKSKLARHHPAG